MFNKLSLYILFVLLITSCNSRKSQSTEGSDASSTDSIDSITADVPDVRLPDTIYPSVAAMNYKVSVMDTTINPLIVSLKDLYSDTPGTFTFRNGIHRLANFNGNVTGRPSSIDVIWSYETRYKGEWGGGTGWTGQPLYIEWPDSCMHKLRASNLIKPEASNKEIMVGSLNGSVYFLDFNTGNPSREPIEVGNPIKGTMSIDPTLNGNLYVGHGVPDHRPFGSLVIDLFNNNVSHVFPEDPNAQRKWGAYDSSPLRLGQFLFRPGENGTLYKWLIGQGKLTLQSTLRYTVNGSAPGIESSMAIYHNYGYTADNHGNIVCVNLDTMKPVWCYKVGDDIDSSIVLIVENDTPYIYTGCEVDRQKDGDAKYVKINGLDGSLAWELKMPARQRADGKKHFDGGFYSTALPGTGNCSNLLFVNCVLNSNGSNGVFLAIDRHDGSVKYQTPTKHYAWSSPVGFLNENDEMYVVTGDCSGYIYIIDGAKGEILSSKLIGKNFESSPVVIGDEFVVGSRGETIYKMKIK